MSTRPNPEAEWEARIARIEAAPAAPESWEVLRSHPHRLHLHDGEPWSLADGRRKQLADALRAGYGRTLHDVVFPNADTLADALLPVVDAMIRQAQAEALEEAAMEFDRMARLASDWAARIIRARAAAPRVGNDQPDATQECPVSRPEGPRKRLAGPGACPRNPPDAHRANEGDPA